MNTTLRTIVKPLYQSLKYEQSKLNISRLIQKGKEIFLEVGAGNKKGQNGWLTLDVNRNCDLYWDLRKGIPFPDESISKIYSSHFLEHLSFEEGQQFLDECLRTLRQGGIFSISVPDAEIYIKGYLNGNLDRSKFLEGEPNDKYTTKIDYINYIAYMGGHHKYMFDRENLLHILEAKGFKNVHLRDFDPELDPLERLATSIYAEGIK